MGDARLVTPFVEVDVLIDFGDGCDVMVLLVPGDTRPDTLAIRGFEKCDDLPDSEGQGPDDA